MIFVLRNDLGETCCCIIIIIIIVVSFSFLFFFFFSSAIFRRRIFFGGNYRDYSRRDFFSCFFNFPISKSIVGKEFLFFLFFFLCFRECLKSFSVVSFSSVFRRKKIRGFVSFLQNLLLGGNYRSAFLSSLAKCSRKISSLFLLEIVEMNYLSGG